MADTIRADAAEMVSRLHEAGVETVIMLTGDVRLVAEAVATDDGRSAAERLRATVESAVRLLAAHRPAVTLLLRVRGNTATELWALERRRDFDHQVAELVRAAVADGALRGDVEPRLATRLLFGMINSIVEWYRPGLKAADGVADAVVHLAFDGLRARG